MAEIIHFKLTKTIKNNIDEELDTLEIRHPTTDDLIKLNYPYVFNQDEEPVFNAKKIFEYLSLLSGEVPSTCKKLDFRDIEKFKWFLLAFLTGGKEQAIALLSQS